MKLVMSLLLLVAMLTCFVPFCAAETGGEAATLTCLPVEVCSVCESSNFLHIECEYPQFPTIGASFNQQIGTTVEAAIDAFKKASDNNREMWLQTHPPQEDADTATAPFVFIASWQPDQLNNQYISLHFNIYSFTGGAHGSEQIHTFNCDAVTGKQLSITDFLGNSEALLKKISQVCAADILSQLTSQGWSGDHGIKEMIAEGTSPTPDNFKEFTFDNYNLTIYFQRYQVAPGAAGSLTAQIPLSSLGSIASSYCSCPRVD